MPFFEGISIGSDKHSVVIEIGQSFTKCGFVHEYSPRAILRSRVLIPNRNKLINLHDINDETELYSALKDFIQILYFRYLAVNPKDRRVVMVESIFTRSRFRNQFVKVLFIHFDVQAIMIVPQHLVALATLGVSTALVLDVGYKEALSIPVVEGVTVVDAVNYAPLGGKSIHYRIMDELLQRRASIREKNIDTVVNEPLDEELLEDIKVRTCFVAPFERGVSLARHKTDLDISQISGISSNPADVKYPIDGDKILFIPGPLRESVCEVLFEMYGDEHTLPTLVIDSILRCPLDVRKQLATNILVIGGTSMLPGFKHRLFKELKALVKSCRYDSRLHLDEFKLHALPCKENYASWLGASIFASNEVISTRSITIDQYLRNNMTITDWCDWIPASG